MSIQTFRTFSLWARCCFGAVLCVAVLGVSTIPSSAASTIPHFFNYQGRLMSSGGINVADGTYQIKFSLYSQSSGGTPVWTASGTTAVPIALDVTVTNGLFSVLLGDASFQSQNTLSDIDWNQDGLYLGLTVGADSEMNPRKKLSSVPFAFNSETLQGQYASSTATSTGSSLFAIHQTASDAATAQRTALSIKTEGTSNSNDFLIVGRNDSSDVFTVSRQGSVTTTGNLVSNGSVTLGDATSDRVVFNAYVLSDILPATDLAYRLGDSSHRWLGVDAGTVTTTNLYATTVSSTNALFANATSSWLGATTVSTTNLYVNGQAISSGVPATTATLQTITTNGASTTNQIYAFGGISTSNLTATGTTSLQGTTFTDATGTSVTTTNLFSTYGTVTTLGSTYFTATQATATTFAFTNASGSSLLVSGQSVCLANGTNCQAGSSPIGAYIWSENATNNTIYPTTSTRDVLLGGNTTDTAGFIFDKGVNTSTVIIGNQTGNANLLVGTTTYGGGLDPNFVTDGNDVFVQGQLGSIGGLFSATGVTVGTGSTIFGDGNIYKTTAGDFTLALNNAASNFRFSTGGKESFTVASSGNIGIGVSTPLEALDVSGTVRNVLSSSNTNLVLASSTVVSPGGDGAWMVAVSGRYSYVTNFSNDQLAIYDISSPSSPNRISLTTIGDTPDAIQVVGNYAYVSLYTPGQLQIIDISNPASPSIVSSVPVAAGPTWVVVQGEYAYLTSDTDNSFAIVDISNPASPKLVSTVTGITDPWGFYVQGRYAYVGSSVAGNALKIIDISNPASPAIVGSVAVAEAFRVYVQGRYAYLTSYSQGRLFVVDVANPAAPSVVSSLTLGTITSAITGSGRYLFISGTMTDSKQLATLDISSSTNPVLLSTHSVGGTGCDFSTLSGSYLHGRCYNNNTYHIFKIPGLETSALIAHSAEAGSLSVLSNASIYNQLSVGGGLVVGPGGLLSQGSLAISSTNTTSTFVFAVSSSYAEISNRLTVGGVGVCLANGTNCQAVSATDANWTYAGSSDFIRNATATTDLVLGSAATSTGAPAYFDLSGGTGGTSTFYFGHATNTNVVIGGTSTTVGFMNSAFILDGNDLFASGNIGSASSVYTNGEFVAGTGSTHFGDGNLYKTTAGDFNLALNVASTSWRFSTSGSERFTMASSGNVGIGVTTPLEALDVSGTVRNVLQSGQVLRVKNTAFCNTSNDVFIQGKYAYVAGCDAPGTNLTIYDISNPSSPVQMSSVAAAFWVTDVFVAGRYAYLASTNQNKLVIMDVSNPSSPYIVSTLTITEAQGVYVSGNYAYVGRYNSTNLYIIDISNPTLPSIVGTATVGNDTFHIAMQGKYIYTASKLSSSVSVVDVSNPKNPVTVTTTNWGLAGGLIRDIAVSGRYAYVAQTNYIRVLDVSDPVSLTTVTTTYISGDNMSVDVAGRYVYALNSTDHKLYVVDVSDPSQPTVLTSAVSVNYGLRVKVSGRYVYAVGAVTSPFFLIHEIPGIETSALLAHSAEVGSLSVLTNASIYNQLSVGGGLTVGPGGLLSQGSLAISSTNTTSTFVFAVSSTNAEISNRLTVGGVSVCLANGTNCQTASIPIGAYVWDDRPAENIIYPTTSTRDIMLGGSTTETANFILDKNGVTSTVIIGSYTGNANLLVGTTTYGGGLDVNFVMNGNDVFVQGMIGSQEGLFSATGVTVGTGSTIFGDGNIYKTTAGDFTLALNDPASNWRMYTNGAERFTVASSGNVGIGISNPLEALDVSGNVRNVYQPDTVLSVIGTATLTNGAATPISIFVSGRYAYTANQGNDSINVIDVSVPAQPVVVGTSTLPGGSTLNSIFISGRYAYTANLGSNKVSVIDISNPNAPIVVGSSMPTVGFSPYSIFVSGRYAYTANQNNDTVSVIDVINPIEPTIVGTANLTSGANPVGIYVSGRYAYTAGVGSGDMNVIDISNPALPTVVGTSTLGVASGLYSVYVQGRYAYTANNGDSTVNVIDVSNSASPVVVGTSTLTGGSGPRSISVSGRYAYTANAGNDTVSAIDVSSPQSPVVVGTSTLAGGSTPSSIFVSGKYAYTANTSNETVSIVDLKGVETSALLAHSAEVGSLSVLTNGSVFNNFNVGGALTAGLGGIYSNGPLGVYATSTFNSAIIAGSLAIGSTPSSIGERLQVEGNILIRKRSSAVAESWGAAGTSLVNAPSARYSAASVWTGSKMMVWGGYDGSYLNDGGIYDPINDVWTTMSTTNAPDGRSDSKFSVWTGSKMIIWGGYGSTGVTSTGAMYDPLTDSWRSVTSTNAPVARDGAAYVWTGSKMIVWGGRNSGGTKENSGAVYDPVSDTWTTMSTTNAPSARDLAAAVWSTAAGTSSKMIVWGGKDGVYLNTGAMYDPATDTWTTMSTTNAPVGAEYPGNVWTGSKMIVWGGDNGSVVDSGGIYDPVANSWKGMTTSNAPLARREHVMVWTGSNALVWGGWDMVGTRYDDGAAYDPINDTWTTLAATNAPEARRAHAAVWTGSKMVVWGGFNTGNLSSGSIYTPSQYQGNLMVEGDGYVNGGLQVVGDVHSGGFYSQSGSDFAEYMPVDTESSLGTPSAGDVVVLSEGSGNRIAKSSASSRRFLAGAITNRPAVVGNANDAYKDDPDHYALVSMLGQVDVKFSPKNGNVLPGDYLMAGDNGYAVKAKGPGTVLGQALQAGDATSSILTYVNPHWWAGDLLTSNGDANFLSSDLNVSSKGSATTSTPAFGSNLFSFQGSAYDASSDSSFNTSFSLKNDTVSATSSFFTLSFATGTNAQSSVLTISNLGDVAVTGDLTVGKRLFLGSRQNGTGSSSTYIYVDDTLAPSSTYIATNADGWSTSSTYDYAERYFSDDNLTPGELVAIDTHNPEYVKRTNGASDVAIGIVSTKPGFVTGGYMKGTYPVALAGRVPTRVMGPIEIGDPITASDVPGLGQKAGNSGFIVGYALEAYPNPDQGTVTVFIQPGWNGFLSSDGATGNGSAASASGPPPAPGSVRSGLAKIFAGSKEVTVHFQNIGAYPLIQATPYGETKAGYWLKDVKDDSFTIEVGEAPTFDLVFAWSVQASALGNTMSFSDNTYLPYDPTSGQAYGPVLPPPAESTSTVTASSTTSTD